MVSPKYPIKNSLVYFCTGRSTHDNRQVMFGRQGSKVLCVSFSDTGEYVGYDVRKVREPVTDHAVSECINSWMLELGVANATIHVQAFEIPDQAIGIYDLPDNLRAFVNAPHTLSPAERGLLSDELAAWKRGGNFVLRWNDEYWMSADGEVEST